MNDWLLFWLGFLTLGMKTNEMGEATCRFKDVVAMGVASQGDEALACAVTKLCQVCRLFDGSL